MPKNPYLVYIRDNLKKPIKEKKPGPVITISREFGCLGSKLINGLATKINDKYGLKDDASWKPIEKEVINEASDELELHPDIIDRISKEERKGILSDMIHSTPYLPDDIKVKKTIAKIVYGLAYQGNVIILGRGGVVLTREIEASLHIYIYAPKEWRIKQIMDLRKISKEEASELVSTVDTERIYLKHLFAGEKVTYEAFNACLNFKDFTMDQLEDEIIHMAQMKGLFSK